jgi:glycine C-acetyltransferase
LFSNSLAPSVVGIGQAALDMLMANADIARSLLDKTHRFRKSMTAAGFKLSGDADHPICPVMLGDARCVTIQENMASL